MAELSDKDIEFIKELREKRDENSISRRGALALLGATGVGAGSVLGGNEIIGSAKADASTSDSDGNVGTQDDRVDVFADGVDTISINSGGPLSDGDGTERQIWIIANGASDPTGADPEDIIFEEES